MECLFRVGLETLLDFGLSFFFFFSLFPNPSAENYFSDFLPLVTHPTFLLLSNRQSASVSFFFYPVRNLLFWEWCQSDQISVHRIKNKNKKDFLDFH